ncbi:MAG: PAS domain S-box protein [Gammaproteobacteria bacterium]|nr:PAS domain S-box protein [Gammaproteobacteria bacterium]
MESLITIAKTLRTLFDASLDAMALVKVDSGKFVAINDSHSRLFGYSLEALNKLGLGRLYQLNSQTSAAEALNQLKQAEPYEVFIWRASNHLGGIVNVEITGTDIEIDGGNYLLLVNKPISESSSTTKFSGMTSIAEAFHDAEAKWRSITEHSADHIMLLDTQGTILYINHTVPGLSIEQVIGLSAYNFVKPEQVPILKNAYQNVIKTGQPTRFEIDYETANDVIYLENHVGPVLRDGKVIALTVASRDVSRWRNTLKALEKSQEHLRHALEASQMSTWEWDLETNNVLWSDGVESMFGMESGSFQGSYEAFFNLVHPDDRQLLNVRIQQTLEHDVPLYVEHRCIYPDGSLHWLNSRGKVYRDASAKPQRIIGTITDITQRRESEEALRQSEFLLAKSQEIAHIGSYSWDVASNKYTWSDEMYRIFGLTKEIFDGSPESVIENAVHPKDRNKLYEGQKHLLETKKPQPMEFRITRPDGGIRHVYANAYLNFDNQGNVKSTIGTVQDITERKLAEAALRESQQKLTLHFQLTPLGVISFDTNFRITEWNPAAEKIFGFTREEALGRLPVGFIVSEKITRDVDKIWNALLKLTAGTRNTNENITKSGKTIICEWYNTPLINATGEVIGVASLVEDVTARITAQRELEKHRRHLEDLVNERTAEIREQALIINQIHDSVIATDLHGYVTSWNRGSERMFGYPAEEAAGKHISFICPEDQREFLINDVINPLLEKGEHETEVRLRRQSGEEFYALLSLSVQHDEKGKRSGLIGYSIDISDRKAAEAQILQQQKALETANRELEAFSYSVSHDLRAPLRSIDGFSSVIYDDYYDLLDDEGKHNLQRIRHNTQRMAALIDDLLQLSRVTRQEFHKEHINLSLLARDVIQKYKYENPDRDVKIIIDENMNDNGDAGLLRIALDNLISNAWKYTGKLQHAEIAFHKVKLNGSFAYCIEDNGVGFDMRYVDKLFGAFQRLHSPDEFSGNGIGLATVSRIIQRHGGKIWAEGKINKGARFYFTLNIPH